MSEPQKPLPTDLISMAADGRLKSCDLYLELIEDKLAIEQDIASMEAQLLTSDRSEEWRNSCLFNLGQARNELRSVKQGLLQIEELCRIVCKMLTEGDREERRRKHELEMAQAKAKKAEAIAKPHSELLASQERIAIKSFEEKTKRFEMSLNRDLRRAQHFKRLVKPILGEDKYRELCTEATTMADAELETLQSTEHQNQTTKTSS